MNRTFKSKVGGWYYGTLIFLVATFSYAYYEEGMTPNSPEFSVFILSGVLSVGVMLWLLKTTDYSVSHDTLLIRCGPIKWHIKRSEIQEIKPGYSLLSSPALSMDRLVLHFGEGRKIMVSPKDKKGFISALGFTPPR
jgi:hypothetical protein